MPEEDLDDFGREVLDRLTELALSEQDGTCQYATLTMGPFTTYTLIAMLQLVQRHPEISAAQLHMAQSLLDQLSPMYTGVLAESIRRGAWHG